ncbi:hypothetical protein Cs7R123_35450 [Catellatospora sp. TT07R-123]|uniref:hypothetical protein n=1 Tax=Catellatospora sp. TT07R-123 TaxID=2733863 RepID=UPI001B1D9204|nr:hypothetical protein [Catellatospora sp. TT07R-123]GHJ46203.1 hypothetical protein Cs7R123_35450 [Catellatospora sp. TT07R-123]
MSDRDPLRDALAGTADAVRPLLTPPGADAARRTLRRRRRTRPAAAAVLAVVAVLGLSPLIPGRGGLPAVDTSPSPAGSSNPWWSVASDSAGPSLSPSEVLKGGAQAPGSPQPKGTPRCVKRGYVWITGPGDRGYQLSGIEQGQLYYRICPGETIRVFWAQYRYEPDGSQKLYASHVYLLTYANPTVYATIDEPADCHGDLYFVAGGRSIRQTIARGDQNAYGDDALSATFWTPC